MTPEYKEQIRDLWAKHGFRPIDLFGSKWADDRGCPAPNEAYAWAFVEALLGGREPPDLREAIRGCTQFGSDADFEVLGALVYRNRELIWGKIIP